MPDQTFRGNLIIATRPANNNLEVLVGRKKRGLLAGMVVFPGGSIDFTIPGEWRHEAGARELEEETGIRQNPKDLRQVGQLFVWGERLGYIDIFHAQAVTDEPTETNELVPEWRQTGTLNFYDGMPEDVPHWFDAALKPDFFRFHSVWRDSKLIQYEMEAPDDKGAVFRYMRETDNDLFP